KQIKIIKEKKFCPKNFLLYGDSDSGKTTILDRLSSELSKGKEICIKAKDKNYIDYNNNEVLVHNELSYDIFKFEYLLSVTEKDKVTMSRKNRSAVLIVTKYNIFTAQHSFADIFSFNTRRFDKPVFSIEQMKALYRHFSQSPVYTHGYIIRLFGRYIFDGRVKFTIETIANLIPSNIQDFVNSRFDIIF